MNSRKKSLCILWNKKVSTQQLQLYLFLFKLKEKKIDSNAGETKTNIKNLFDLKEGTVEKRT